jgi:hypothetical protein
MKQEMIFRYAGSLAQFKPLQEELEQLGLRIHYLEKLCTDTSITGVVQSQSDEDSLVGILESRSQYLKEKGIKLEDSLTRYKC